MIQKLKKKLKEQRGMTLIELLAVIVILAIISAIAIPSILGLIDNSKKDAHVANAQQMINSAKLAVAGDDTVRPANSSSKFITITYLEEKGYLETMKDPDGASPGYTKGTATTPVSTAPTTGSYVEIRANASGKITYYVYLTNGTKTIPLTEEKDLKRSVVSS